MKMIAKKNMLALGLSMAVLAGCSSTDTVDGDTDAPVEAPTTADSSAEVSTVDNGEGVESTEMTDAAKAAAEAAAKEKEAAALREIRTFYFDFDKADIKAESRLPLMAHAKFLSSNSSMKIVLEGHADERGTREYNVALAERRAQSVERFLVVNGAAKDQIEVVSFGEERPADAGHDDAAWSKNRRAVIVYK